MKKLNILGVSAGQGALLYPFLNEKRFRIVGNIEPRAVFHTKNEEQWKLNFNDIPFVRDFITLDRVDIIVSSPDCGASSVMRLSKSKKLGNPEKNKSFNLVLFTIKHYKPKIFLIENLPRLLSLISQEFLEKSLQGYRLIYHQRSVSDYGNSQVSRKRLVIIGIREDLPAELLENFTKVYKVEDLKCTRELLEPAYYDCNNDNYMPPKSKTMAMYDYRLLPDKTCLSIRKIHKLWITDFEDEKKWPIKTDKMKTLPGVYRLEEIYYPLTLRPADRQFRPDGWPLGISDFKNIMGFPKEYKIFMDHSNYLYWLNKARYTLAKGSVYQVGEWFKDVIKSSKLLKIKYLSIPLSREKFLN